MTDTFDQMMISTCDILFKAGAAVPDAYGQDTQALTAVVTGWPCRLSTLNFGKELKNKTQGGISRFKVFMRLPNVTVTNHHYIRIGGVVYNIIDVSDPSNLHHHLEILVELVTP